MEKPEFKTLKSYAIDFGTRNFLELALKEAVEGGESNSFVSVSKGYTDQGGRKHYKRSLGFKVDAQVIDFLMKNLADMKTELEKMKK